MFAIIKALVNANTSDLCFVSKEDAERFKQFVNTYMEESGAGNGYDSAYWVLIEADILGCEQIPNFCSTTLNEQLLESMLKNIVFARTAGAEIGENVKINIGEKNGALTFSFDELPPRQKPGVGDMFRGLFSLGAPNMEGRVIRKNGKILTVISCWDEKKDGNPKSDAKYVELNENSVMKINDWMAGLREESAKQ